jgi:2',3'-cyclic-nucleotide 2'-phosphodiesterase (5'-nucleotidase family)
LCLQKWVSFNCYTIHMNKVILRFFFPAAFLLIFSCKPAYKASSVQYKDYKVENTQTDTSFNVFLSPYSDSVNRSMNMVIATLATDLEKKQPESTLGNLMADAMKTMASKYYGMNVDAAFVNYGGIRLPVVKAGVITKGKIFELMPFDNIIIIQKMQGKVLKEFLDHVASRGGWPVSGLTMQIKNSKAENVIINGKPLDLSATYTIANSDYVANGGDKSEMLRVIPQINNGSLFRDALIEYFSSFTKAGKQITVTIENRVTNAQ